MPISVVILAAGQGKRMKSDLPKVLQPVAGRPLLQHVIDSARELSASDIHVVYGHGGERVRETLAAENVTWALQAEQLGTGHAVQQAMPAVPDDHLVLILFGDVPLVQAATMQRLVEAAAGGEALGVLSVRMQDPTGYGRIVRDRAGTVARIVEHKDANQKERAIDEVNTGLMAASAKRMREWLAQLRNDNAQGEYYLTDVVVLAAKAGLKVNVIPADSEDEVLGVNDKVQLAEVESIYRKRRATELMLQGVTLVDPARFDARGPVTVGRDVHIDVNVVLEGKVRLGNRVRIGPNVVIRDSEIGDDTVVFPNCVIDSASIGPNCNIGPFARFRPSSEPGPRRARRQFRRGEEQHPGRRRQGQPPDVPGGCDSRRESERRRRHHHLQLRRREQVAHGDRRGCVHRLGCDAGGTREDRCRSHDRRRLDDHEGRCRTTSSRSSAASN